MMTEGDPGRSSSPDDRGRQAEGIFNLIEDMSRMNDQYMYRLVERGEHVEISDPIALVRAVEEPT